MEGGTGKRDGLDGRRCRKARRLGIEEGDGGGRVVEVGGGGRAQARGGGSPKTEEQVVVVSKAWTRLFRSPLAVLCFVMLCFPTAPVHRQRKFDTELEGG